MPQSTNFGTYGPSPVTPQTQLDSQLGALHSDIESQWKIEIGGLKGTWFKDRGSFNSAVSKINTKYRLKEYETQKQVRAQAEERERKQQLISSGRLPGKPLSIGQLESPNLASSMLNFSEQAKNNPNNLMEAYAGWRNYIGYNNYNPEAKRQLDNAWDIHMSSDKKHSSWKQARAIRQMVRSPGPGAAAIRARAVGGSPFASIMKKPKSPSIMRTWGNAVVPTRPVQRAAPTPQPQAPQQPVTGEIRVKAPNGQIGSIPASQWAEAQKTGYTRI